MKFITYYFDMDKDNLYYEQCFHNLKTNLQKLNYELIGENINFKNLKLEKYEKINLYKPTYILNKLKELKESMVWIDADTKVNSHIKEFEIDNYDIIFVNRKDKIPYAGCIYFNNTEESITFLKKWEMICIEKYFIDYNCTEHCLLVDLLKNYDNDKIKINFIDNIASTTYNLEENNNNSKILFGLSKNGVEFEKSLLRNSNDIRKTREKPHKH